MDSKNKSINLKLTGLLIILAIIFCIICLFSKSKFDYLMNEFMLKQVAARSSLVLQLIHENLHVKADALTGVARQIETDWDHTDEILYSMRNNDITNRYGIYSMSGEIFAQDIDSSIAPKNYHCILESFRGKPAVCSGPTNKLMMSVPVYNKQNVQYVFYKLLKQHDSNKFFDVDCKSRKCHVSLLDKSGHKIVESAKGDWGNLEPWKSLNYTAIFDTLKTLLKKTSSAVISKEIDDSIYYFYMVELKQYNFFIEGMVSRQTMSKGLDDISNWVIRTISILTLLCLLWFVAWYYITRRNKLFATKNFSDETNDLSYTHILKSIGLKIRKNAKSSETALLELSNDLMNIAKFDFEQNNLTTEKYDLFALLSNCYAIIGKNGSTFYFNLIIDPGTPTILIGDRSFIELLIKKIFICVKQYVAGISSNVRISYETIHQEKEDDNINLIITFKQSNSVDLTIETSLIKRIVQLMSGEFIKENSLDKIDFTIKIPQKIASYETMGNFKNRYDSYAKSFKNGTHYFYAPNATILTVDAMPMNLRIINNLLSGTCVKLDTANNNADAIEKMKSCNYDLVIFDSSMLYTENVDFFKMMKSNNINLDIPFVMLIDETNQTLRDNCKKYGCETFLAKPIRENELLEIVGKTLPQNLVQYYKTNNNTNNSHNGNESIEPIKLVEKLPEYLKAPNAILPTESELSENLENLLTIGNLDVYVGLSYCKNNETIYLKKIKNFVNLNIENLLTEFLSTNDFENYRIYMKYIKSESMFIGAISVAGIAKMLESACDKGDYDYVKNHNNELLHKFKNLIQSLNGIL